MTPNSFRTLEARVTMLITDERGMSTTVIAAKAVSDSLRVQLGARTSRSAAGRPLMAVSRLANRSSSGPDAALMAGRAVSRCVARTLETIGGT